MSDQFGYGGIEEETPFGRLLAASVYDNNMTLDGVRLERIDGTSRLVYHHVDRGIVVKFNNGGTQGRTEGRLFRDIIRKRDRQFFLPILHVGSCFVIEPFIDFSKAPRPKGELGTPDAIVSLLATRYKLGDMRRAQWVVTQQGFPLIHDYGFTELREVSAEHYDPKAAVSAFLSQDHHAYEQT